MKELIKTYRGWITNESVIKRFAVIFVLFFLVFYSLVILSQLYLPEGILRGKNSGDVFDTSSNLWISSFQIFSWNMLSVGILMIANLFAYRKNEDAPFVSYGILSMMVWAIIDGITLGTNSFGIQRDNTDLPQKLLGTFDLLHRAGMWELTGLICIASVFQQKSLILTTNKTTIKKKFGQLKFTKADFCVLILGLLLMMVGAIIESTGIISLV
jgi:hypothetical protein